MGWEGVWGWGGVGVGACCAKGRRRGERGGGVERIVTFDSLVQ